MKKILVLLVVAILLATTLSAKAASNSPGFWGRLFGISPASNVAAPASLGVSNEGDGSAPSVPCPGGASMPRGQNSQTIRCNFQTGRWEANYVITNTGQFVGINNQSPQFSLDVSGRSKIQGSGSSETGAALWVKSVPAGTGIVVGDNSASSSGVGITATDALGVVGVSDSNSGAGVVGSTEEGSYGSPASSAVAVRAVAGANKFGFYQVGNTAKNYLGGKLGLGIENPAERLDLGGGNIKMGYEQIVNSSSTASNVSAFCPPSKKVIAGGCWAGGLASTNARIYNDAPVSGLGSTGWLCAWTEPVPQVNAFAICANIK